MAHSIIDGEELLSIVFDAAVTITVYFVSRINFMSFSSKNASHWGFTLHASYSIFFFFSSRRRHTRFKCDWSSDVCSSDLAAERRDARAGALRAHPRQPEGGARRRGRARLLPGRADPDRQSEGPRPRDRDLVLASGHRGHLPARRPHHRSAEGARGHRRLPPEPAQGGAGDPGGGRVPRPRGRLARAAALHRAPGPGPHDAPAAAGDGADLGRLGLHLREVAPRDPARPAVPPRRLPRAPPARSRGPPGPRARGRGPPPGPVRCPPRGRRGCHRRWRDAAATARG